jgi:UDP-GlcNAc:undecaprenyl-phosphate GlcNAc-1-phosphate transferase
MSSAALASHLILAAALGLLSSVIVRAMIRVGTLDNPGARSSHVVPTPKGGGVGIVVSFLVGTLVLYLGADHARIPNVPFLGFLTAGLCIAAVSYADDRFDMPFVVKLGAQLGAAVVAIASGIVLQVVHLPWVGAVDLGWLGWLVTGAWILFVTNAVNFIDGLNGLASGSVGIACVFMTCIAWSQGDGFVFVAALMLAAGIAGFLPFNFPRARIFMGDVGSQFCGFTIAVLGVLAGRFGAPAISVLLVPALLFGVFFDVAFTLVRRLVAGERLTQAHRSHLYQVANRAGMPASSVTLVHWAMVIWGGACSLLPGRPVALVLVPQAAWLALVTTMAARAKLGRW